MMMNSSAAEKMKDDPRFKAAMGLNWYDQMKTQRTQKLEYIPNELNFIQINFNKNYYFI